VAGFAHAGDDDAAGAVQAQCAGLCERGIQARRQLGQGALLDLERAPPAAISASGSDFAGRFAPDALMRE
jgi:hypothetical protein